MIAAIIYTIAGASAFGILMNAIATHRKSKARKPIREFVDGEYIEISQKIVKYKGRTGRKVGKFFAYREFNVNDNRVHIGFAVCCPTDQYDEESGMELALDRADNCFSDVLQIPKSIEAEFLEFYGKCERYFGKGYLPSQYELYNNTTQKYERVTVTSALLHDCDFEKPETVYFFELLEAPQIPIVPVETIPLNEDCEPDH